MVICTQHPKRPTPLIQTLAFRGAEQWCPYCGMTCGIHDGTHLNETPELVKVQEEDKVKSKDYLKAIRTRSCSSLEFEGKRIKPEELPESEKKKNTKIINAWKYADESAQ